MGSRILDEIARPIVLAPLGGGPSTPELAAAVSSAGGLGFLAAGYLTAEETADRIASTRALTNGPFGVNIFAPVPGPADPDSYRAYLDRLRSWADDRGAGPLGDARYSDDRFEAKLEVVVDQPPAVVSFAFGCPTADVIERIHRAGSEVWITVTAAGEADRAEAVGADALVVQGAEAGGHRGGFADGDSGSTGLLPLLQLIRDRLDLSLVASGGIATGAGVAAVLCAGAAAAQLGSAFMACPEAGTSDAHREALRADTPTSVTRAFTGRSARGIVNQFMEAHRDAPAAYPEIHYATAPLRQRARSSGDASLLNLWAGEAHALVRELPAAELVDLLMSEAKAAVAEAAPRLSG